MVKPQARIQQMRMRIIRAFYLRGLHRFPQIPADIANSAQENPKHIQTRRIFHDETGSGASSFSELH